MFRRPVEVVGRRIIGAIEEFGRFVLLTGETLLWAVLPPYRVRNLLQAMEFVGFGSLFIVLLTSVFTGMVFALQGAYAFGLFDATAMVGPTVGLSLARELGPVLTALMVSGRAGSGMATELGTMRVTEQIDALEAMAVNPVQFLVVPRVLGALFMVPALTMLFDLLGFAGSYLVGVGLLDIDSGAFVHYTVKYVNPKDIWSGLVKAAVFGTLVALIGCFKGFFATGGAKGVGEATTKAVVVSSVTVLVSDYFLNLMLW